MKRDQVALLDKEPFSPMAVLAAVKTAMLQKCAATVNLHAQTLDCCVDEIAQCAGTMARAFADERKLLAFGNGSSATDAQDVAVNCMLHGLPALALTNDAGFENNFLRQVVVFGKPGDLVIGIASSGASHDIAIAFEKAHDLGLVTIGLAGAEHGALAELHRGGIIDFCFVVPSTDIPRIQETHTTIYHTLIELTQRLLVNREIPSPHSVFSIQSIY